MTVCVIYSIIRITTNQLRNSTYCLRIFFNLYFHYT
nr:MAG TPA: hypothetical protein [Caudoviricetes sp.]